MGMTNVPHAVNVTIGMGEKYENIQKQTRSAPTAILDPLCEPGWYICPFDGRKKRTWDNPAPEDAQDIKSCEASQAPAYSSATSDTSAIVDEVR